MGTADNPGAVGRRQFLMDLAAAGAALGSAGALAGCIKRGGAGGSAAKPSLDRLGVQLYSVMDQMRQDFDGTLEKVAAIGYRNVEFAGYFERTPEQVRALLDRLHLAAPSSHIGLDLLRSDLPQQVAIAQTIGHRYITAPSLGRTELPRTADGWKRIAEEFNGIGAALKSRGIGLAFHSHSGEFLDVGARKGMDVFVTESDPALVSFEIDLMWAEVASEDPVAWIERYPGRFKMWHVKDMRDLKAAQAQQQAAFRGESSQRAGQIAPVGAGEIDFKRIFEHWRRSGLEYYFVEHDAAQNWPGGSLASIESSYKYLQQLLA